MRLFLVQHGQAKAESEDPDRPLTDQGAADVARVARHTVERLEVRPARVIHSGKTRARQTAELWAHVLDAPVEEADALAPKDDPATWAERLERDGPDVMLVGHLPHLGRLAGLLSTGDADHSVVRFRPGGLVALERTDAGWEIIAVVPPEVAS